MHVDVTDDKVADKKVADKKVTDEQATKVADNTAFS